MKTLKNFLIVSISTLILIFGFLVFSPESWQEVLSFVKKEDTPKITKEDSGRVGAQEQEINEIKSESKIQILESSQTVQSVGVSVDGNEHAFAFKANLKVGEKNFELSFDEGEKLYKAMDRLRSLGELNFSGENFPVLGFFVREIENLKEGNDEFLFFDINGVEASVGISNYKLKQGDTIEWRLK